VTATNAQGTSPTSAASAAFTPTAPAPTPTVPAPTAMAPGKVTKAKKAKVRARKATVKWKKPANASDMTGMKFQYRIKANKKWKKWKTRNAAKLAAKKGWYTKTWKKLAPNTRYVVKIRASNSAGKSKTVTVKFKTKKKKKQ
jgi:hypothetical protein